MKKPRNMSNVEMMGRVQRVLCSTLASLLTLMNIDRRRLRIRHQTRGLPPVVELFQGEFDSLVIVLNTGKIESREYNLLYKRVVSK